MNEPGQSLEPLPYHREMRDYLKAQERELWKWFASARAQADYKESLRLELLKTTYRLDPDGHADLYRGAENARQRLGLDIPVTLYQAQHSTQPNAALFFVPGEGHVALSGPVVALLSADELQSLIGHELAHYLLWQAEDGEFQVADRLLQAVAQDPRASTSHIQSARWYQLYTEIFADRGSFRAAGDLNTVISGLVKIQTGLPQVSAASYLKQADEIFARSRVQTGELSHPEAFIRVRALALWTEGREGADEAVCGMIEGAAELDEFDLLSQARLTRATRRFLEQLLRPKWFQTESTLAHARLFFDDFKPATAPDDALELALSNDPMKLFFASLLLDFAAADPDLDPAPMAAALDWSRRLGIESEFERLATKELRIKAREFRKMKEETTSILAKAGAS
jgi:hypothetical protein